MPSDLSIFAARLREFISISAAEPTFGASPGREVDVALRAHLDAEFNAMALVLFARQFAHNLAFRKFCAARKITPDDVAHWTQIPAVPAAAFKEFELSCLPPIERTAVFHSSGTTEQKPSRHFHSAESLAVYEASLWPWFQRHVLADSIGNPQLAILLPPPVQAPHSSLVHMCDVVRRALRAPESAFVGAVTKEGSWSLDLPALLEMFRAAISARRPLLIPGTAFAFVHLLDHLAEQELQFALPPGSRVMETGGYKGRSRALPRAELHALLARRLGVPDSHIVCEYGMSELSSQAYDREVRSARCEVRAEEGRSSKRIFHFPPWARAQIISPETGREVGEGETGLIRVIDLANVFSVMAIQTEDLGVRRGDGFELLGRAEPAEPRGCSLMAQNG